MRVRHSESKAIIRSGEVGSLREETRVGELRLRTRRSAFVSDSVVRVPLVSASVHVI